MLEGVVRQFGEMPEMLREGMETKINSALYMIHKYQRKTKQKLVRIGLCTENGCCLQPKYFFRTEDGQETSYTKQELREELANYSTTVVIGKNQS